MFIYAFWDRHGNTHFQAFHKSERAVKFVLDQIDALLGGRATAKKRSKSAGLVFEEIALPPAINYGNVQPKIKKVSDTDDLAVLKAHLEATRKNPTIKDALKAIELYDEYAKYVLGNPSAIHTLEEVRLTE